MQFSSYLTTAVAAIGLVTFSAQAANFTWVGGTSRAWTTASNWNPNTGYPDDSGDTATIPDWDTTNNDPLISTTITVGTIHVDDDGYAEVGNGAALTVTDITIDDLAQFDVTGNATIDLTGTLTADGYFQMSGTSVADADFVHVLGGGEVEVGSGSNFEVQDSAGLDIDASGLLDVIGIVELSGGGENPVDGQVTLGFSTSQFKIVTTDASLKGAGNVTGSHDSAKIDVASGKVLTLMTVTADPFDVVGNLTIQGSGTVDNDGKITANVSGGVLSISSVTLTGSGGFEASGNSLAVMTINVDSVCGNMSARWSVKNNATIDFFNDADISTSGTFLPGSMCGKLNFDASGGSFTYDCGGGSPVTINVDTTYSGGCPP